MRSSISTEAGHCAKCFGARLFSKMSATKTTCDTSLASLADLATSTTTYSLQTEQPGPRKLAKLVPGKLPK